jgi:hypothetical protein
MSLLLMPCLLLQLSIHRANLLWNQLRHLLQCLRLRVFLDDWIILFNAISRQEYLSESSDDSGCEDEDLEPPVTAKTQSTSSAHSLLINHGAANHLVAKTIKGKPSMRIKPSIFKGDGSESIKTWIYHFKQAAQINCWDDDMARVSVPAFLQGYAQTWYETTGKNYATIHDFLDALQHAFTSPHEEEVALRHLRTRTQQPGEPVIRYVQEMLDHLTKLPNMPIQQQIQNIQAGLLPKYQPYLVGFQFKSVQDLLGRVQQLEATQGTTEPSRVLAISGTPTNTVNEPSLESKIEAIVKKVTRQTANIDRVRRDRVSRGANGGVICWNCAEPGHISKNCKKEKKVTVDKKNVEEGVKKKPVNVIDWETPLEQHLNV